MPPPAEEPAFAEEPPAAEAPSPEPVLRSIDESVLAVLREEAEREVEARKSEAPPVIETQTEMGLVPATGPARVARREETLTAAPPPGISPEDAARAVPALRPEGVEKPGAVPIGGGTD